MMDHFGFSQKQIDNLKNKKIGIPELFKFANENDLSGNRIPISTITLYNYVDKKGDFMTGPKFKSKEICKEIFNNLDSCDQIQLLKYIDAEF